jgi:uncharacterized protein YjbJ (UPF0337 family)
MVEKKQVKKAASRATAQVKNAAHVAKGTVKQSTGKALGDRKLQAKGTIEKTIGRVKQTGERAKRSLDG